MLSHFSKCPIKAFSNVLHRGDNEHKPGGLWLSDESGHGWSALVPEQLRLGSSGWEDGDELLRYRYDFSIDPKQLDRILVLRTPDDLRSFTSDYREASQRECVDDGKPGYGLHIDWSRVKSDYKGILITPYQSGLSHRNGTPDSTGYRFDCASGCFWDIICLRPLRWPVQRGLPRASAPVNGAEKLGHWGGGVVYHLPDDRGP